MDVLAEAYVARYRQVLAPRRGRRTAGGLGDLAVFARRAWSTLRSILWSTWSERRRSGEVRGSSVGIIARIRRRLRRMLTR